MSQKPSSMSGLQPRDCISPTRMFCVGLLLVWKDHVCIHLNPNGVPDSWIMTAHPCASNISGSCISDLKFPCASDRAPMTKAVSKSSLVSLLLPEVAESHIEKTSQSLAGSLYILCPNRESSLASKEPYTKYYKKKCKIISFKWLFFLLALALGSLGRGCHMWQILFLTP